MSLLSSGRPGSRNPSRTACSRRLRGSKNFVRSGTRRGPKNLRKCRYRKWTKTEWTRTERWFRRRCPHPYGFQQCIYARYAVNSARLALVHRDGRCNRRSRGTALSTGRMVNGAGRLAMACAPNRSECLLGAGSAIRSFRIRMRAGPARRVSVSSWNRTLLERRSGMIQVSRISSNNATYCSRIIVAQRRFGGKGLMK